MPLLLVSLAISALCVFLLAKVQGRLSLFDAVFPFIPLINLGLLLILFVTYGDLIILWKKKEQ